MDRLKEKIVSFVSTYRWAIVILAAGILLLIPTNKESVVTEKEQPDDPALSQSLTKILEQMDGVGKAKVLLTEKVSTQIIYQTDNLGERVETVIISDAERNQQGLIQYTNSPIYLGAVVVCQGGDDPNVQLKVIEAVSDLTGLSSDKISVLKMKSLEE